MNATGTVRTKRQLIEPIVTAMVWQPRGSPAGGDPWQPEHLVIYLVGGLEHEFCFPIYWEFHHPN